MVLNQNLKFKFGTSVGILTTLTYLTYFRETIFFPLITYLTIITITGFAISISYNLDLDAFYIFIKKITHKIWTYSTPFAIAGISLLIITRGTSEFQTPDFLSIPIAIVLLIWITAILWSIFIFLPISIVCHIINLYTITNL